MEKTLALAVLILCLFLTGCGAEKAEDKVSMFVKVHNSMYYEIVYHRDTKVMYAVSKGMYNAGNFTVMLDADGQPLLYEGEES